MSETEELKVLCLEEEGLDLEAIEGGIYVKVKALRDFLDQYDSIKNLKGYKEAWIKHGTNILSVVEEISVLTEKDFGLAIVLI